MFSRNLNPTCYITRGLCKHSLLGWSYPLGANRARPLATLALSDVRSKLASGDSSEIKELWKNSWEANPSKALEIRFEFYDSMRRLGLQGGDARWCISLMGSISKDNLRYADVYFAAELLTAQKDWDEIETFMISLASTMPTVWDSIALFIFDRCCPEIASHICLRIVGYSSLSLGVDIAQIGNMTEPTMREVINLLVSRYPAETLTSGLNEIAALNSVMAGSLASALMKVASGRMVTSSRPISPDKSYKIRTSDESYQDAVTFKVWRWKIETQTASPEDLKLCMMFLIFSGRPDLALAVYDDNVSLHDTTQVNEYVLMAAAGSGDYVRLQQVFEEVEQNPKLAKRLGWTRYSIVLGALGYLGNSKVIESIYRTLKRQQPQLLTRGVFHAIMRSHSVRGDLSKTREHYYLMLDHGIKPNENSFTILLEAFRDAADLKGALLFVGDEMIAKQQFGLRNQELTLLMSVCGKRRDSESAKYIWDWGTSLIEPDQTSWTAYLHALINGNKFQDAQRVFDQIERNEFLNIVTLTVMLNAAGRSADPENYIYQLTQKKGELNLVGDDGWYTSLLAAYAGVGNVQKFEETFQGMKATGLVPNSSHYALYTELLAKNKLFEKHGDVASEMQRLRIPINFNYIEKHFRLLVAPGTTPESWQSAHIAAMNLIKNGFFDTSSGSVPRGAIPVRTVEPVVRRLTKTGQFVSAKQLLDGLRKQRVSVPGLRDDFMLWMLYMEIAFKSGNHLVLGKLWSEFWRSLPQMFILAEDYVPSRLADGSFTKPVFKIPRRYRFTCWHAIDIRIQYLQENNQRAELLELPKMLESAGLMMNRRNFNTYIMALAGVGENLRAWEVASSAESQVNFRLSAAAKTALGI